MGLTRLIISALALSFASGVRAESVVCEGVEAVVHYQDERDARTVCKGVADAVDFMDAHGFDTGLTVHVTVVDHADERHKMGTFGHYDSRLPQVTVLSLAGCFEVTKNRLIFGEAMSEELHRSFVVHEIAHAIAEKNFAHAPPSVAAHEYTAYVVQLATMPHELRWTILDRFDVDGFQDDKEITELYWALNPEYFAIKAYRHFLEPENGRVFFRRLLARAF